MWPVPLAAKGDGRLVVACQPTERGGVAADHGAASVRGAMFRWISTRGITTVVNKEAKPWQKGAEDRCNGRCCNECLSFYAASCVDLEDASESGRNSPERALNGLNHDHRLIIDLNVDPRILSS